jgi:transcriptional regulator with XRE-family HTH domain
MSEYAREFGKHVRSLRRARGVTQDVLAQRSGLSADTIRRVEHGAFSASIDTLRKLCGGLGVAPSTLFESFELGHTDERRELFDLLSSRNNEELLLIARVVRVLLDELDGLNGREQPHSR